MPITNDLVKLGFSVSEAALVQSALEGTATANALVIEGFSPTLAAAIKATPPVAADLVKQGMWDAAAKLVVSEYAVQNP